MGATFGHSRYIRGRGQSLAHLKQLQTLIAHGTVLGNLSNAIVDIGALLGHDLEMHVVEAGAFNTTCAKNRLTRAQ